MNPRQKMVTHRIPPRFRPTRLALSVACAMAAASLTMGPDAQAHVTSITLDPVVPAFGGYSFGTVGSYVRLTGTAHGELDPADPKNALIVDIGNAPTVGGKVPYSFNFYILAPANPANANHKAMYEPPNRGRKLAGSFLRISGDPAGGNDPANATDFANSWALNQGYTLIWSGWDFSAGTSTANFNAWINLPIAKDGGATITGPSFEYFVTTNPAASLPLSYPAATLDKTQARLTHRVHLDDVPVDVPPSGWTYNATGKAVTLVPAGFVPNDIYEFSYTAKDPTVNGIGFAAVRDFNSFLRHASAAAGNPVAADALERIYTYTVSQPGRLLNDFIHLGFNQDEDGHIVFDGMVNWIAAGDGINLNLRFSQPGRTERNRQDHLFAEGLFPFSHVTTTDPITGKTDSRFTRCAATSTCPLMAEIYSANEYWVKAASLLHTTPDGTTDLGDSPYARNYFISSHQHGTGNAASKGVCQQFQNPLDSTPIQRALWVDVDQWVTQGIQPPPSAVPRLDNGTLVPPGQSSVGFPHIPGVTYTGLKTTRYRLYYGPRFDDGIMDVMPPVITPPYEDNVLNGPIYPSFVPKTDADGNDIAGIRLPAVAAPTATYTGWALRAGAQANDGCESSGQYIPFAATRAERLSTGDPRLSIEERYRNHGAYVSAVAQAVNDLRQRRLLNDDDAEAYKDAASASSIGK